MRSKALLLFALLALCPVTASAQVLNDSALTPTTSDRIALCAGIADCAQASHAAGTLNSIAFSLAGAKHLCVELDVTVCAACNHQMQLQFQTPDGDWLIWDAPTALTSVTVGRWCYLPTTGNAVTTNSTNITQFVGKVPPTVFRLAVTRVAGSADYALAAWAW